MNPIQRVFVDTMAFSYLAALGQLPLLEAMGARTGKLAVTSAVVRQLHRAGVGATIVTWIRDLKLVKERSS